MQVGYIGWSRRYRNHGINSKSANHGNHRPIDTLATFETGTTIQGAASAPIRYAIRQVLDQEYQKDVVRQRNEARQARFRAGNPLCELVPINIIHKDGMIPLSSKPKAAGAKRDFFGRIVNEVTPRAYAGDDNELENATRKKRRTLGYDQENKVWISFHEGFSNAVRKPITLEEILRGL
jgi:chromosome transmission fidelity protein 18